MVRAAGPASADAAIIGDAGAGVLEAVEVKNTCPFQQVSWVTASGKRRTSYVLRDRGPRAEARGCTDTHSETHQMLVSVLAHSVAGRVLPL